MFIVVVIFDDDAIIIVYYYAYSNTIEMLKSEIVLLTIFYI